MISALLLPLLFSGTSAQPAAATRDDPPIRLWISNDRRFLPGDRANVQVQIEYDGYLVVLHVDPEGRLRVLFPLDPDKDHFVRGDKKYEVRGRGGREAFEADGTGRGSVYAAVSRDPFRFDGFTLGDHWDYQALAPTRLRDDPEPELNDLVHRMAGSSFDYDLLNYDVIERSTYASSYSSHYYGTVYGDDWCFSCGPYYGHSGFGFSIGLFYGSPYRRYYYNPYSYGYYPYSPFFYDPYYYASSYYPRYGYPYGYYGYPHGYYGYQGGYYGYRDRYYPDRNGAYNRPYTPYRFRGSDGSTAGFSERGYDIRRSVNTAYHPPVSRFREPASSTPVRRVTGSPTGDVLAGVTPRRAVGRESRLSTEPVEARRARERDAETALPGEPRAERRALEREAAPARRATGQRDDRPREEPRAERSREEPRGERARAPRTVERAPAPQARSERREVARSSPPQARSSGGSESRGIRGGVGSGGGSRSVSGSRSVGGGRSFGGGRSVGGGGARRR
ncbi:MAG: DUF4384 domain-containing protein [Gemmatimonadales bacterium]